MERQDGSMVLLAIFVSRFEANLVASMLRGYGLLVSVDGEAHASVLYPVSYTHLTLPTILLV